MYRPLPLVRSFLILALGALAGPLCAQQEAAPLTDQTAKNQAALAETAQIEAAQNALIPNPQATGNQEQNQAPGQPQRRRDGREARREQVEMRLRTMMSDFGIDDVAKQDALIAYLAEDEAGKSTVREAGRRLLMALRRGTDPARTRDLVRVYKGALDADKERRAAAQISLDAKIGFSLDPRLEAALWLFGVLGEGQAGLPLNALMPRPYPNATRNAALAPNLGPDGNKAPTPYGAAATLAPRTGTVFGTVSNKGEGWIEVRDQKQALERYMPFWTIAAVADANNPLEGGYDRAVLEAISAVKIGDTVRLEWVWNERKRVVKLQPWTAPLPEATNAPMGGVPNGPANAPNEAEPEAPQQP